MRVYTVYIYVYINTHTYSIYFDNISMYILNIHIIDIIHNFFKCINITFFLNVYMHVCVFIYIYIIKYAQYTHIYYVNKLDSTINIISKPQGTYLNNFKN